jgi:phosphatidylinositol-3-phosphatase
MAVKRIRRRSWIMRSLGISIVLVAAVVARGSGAVTSAETQSSARQHVSQVRAPRLKHVFIIMLENREFSPAGVTPYLHTLARGGAVATNYFAITHPSLPNYIALLAGSTLGVSSDSFAGTLSQSTLVDQMNRARLTWRAFMEDMPTSCYAGVSAGDYVKRHNPFMYLASVQDNPAVCSRVRPLTELIHALKRVSVPNLTWITPNLCHDGHDCSNSSVDSFLRGMVPRITSTRAYRDQGVLFILYDEGTTNSGCCRVAQGGRVELLALGPGIAAGKKITAAADHYSLLRTIEDGFGLRHLGYASCTCTTTLGEAWKP